MATQYDKIGDRYASFKQLPLIPVETTSIKARLGDVTDLDCLDLACGLGDWTRRLAQYGASKVVGVDISQPMVDGAAEVLNGEESEWASKIIHVKGDASKTDELLDILDTDAEYWPFDLVMGNWFLNYASNYSMLVEMFSTIYHNLSQGGKFIGATPNTHCPMFEPVDDGYGIYVEPIAEVDGTGHGESWAKGWKCRLRADVGEGIEFEMYHFMHHFYERAAEEAGLVNLKWHPVVLPMDREQDDFYDRFLLRPHMCVLTARKPGEHHSWTDQEG